MPNTRRRGLFFIVLALILGAAAALSVTSYAASLESEIGQTSAVLMAARDIPRGTKLEPAMVTTLEVPNRYVHAGYARTPEEIVGRVALIDMQQGAIVLTSAFEEKVSLPPDMREVALKVDDVTGAAGGLGAGDRVDVVVSFTTQPEDVSRTMILLQDVPVLRVKSPDAGSGAPLAAGAGGQALVVSLALRVEDAMKVSFMANFGKEVRLIVRPPDAPVEPGLRGVSFEDFR